jgi:hypothetical protein
MARVMILIAAIISERNSEVDTFKKPKHTAIQNIVMAIPDAGIYLLKNLD